MRCLAKRPADRFQTADDLVAALEPLAMPSGAGHDAQDFERAGYPAAMIFVRNPTGASHTPAEFASDDDCVAAAQVMAGALAELTR
jgi:N-carbamoyl-L-amino-acid hydrolase